MAAREKQTKTKLYNEKQFTFDENWFEKNAAYKFILVKRKNDRLSFWIQIHKRVEATMFKRSPWNQIVSHFDVLRFMDSVNIALATNRNEHNMNLNGGGILNAYLLPMVTVFEMILRNFLWAILMGHTSITQNTALQHNDTLKFKCVYVADSFFLLVSCLKRNVPCCTYIKIDCYAKSRSLCIHIKRACVRVTLAIAYSNVWINARCKEWNMSSWIQLWM